MNVDAAEKQEMQCQTSEGLMQSSEEQSYDTSSEQQRSETLRTKGIPISVGDEGGTR